MVLSTAEALADDVIAGLVGSAGIQAVHQIEL